LFIYPDTGHDDGTQRVTDQQRLAERLTATRFGRDRRREGELIP
jgi:hypothetical protein